MTNPPIYRDPARLQQGRSVGGEIAEDDFEAVEDGWCSSPVWFEYLAVAGISAVVSFGGIGLLLALLGRFSGPPAFSLGVLGTVVGTFLGRPHRRGSPAGSSFWSIHLPALAMCAIVIGIAIWNSIFIGRHVAVDSDPGVYTVTGRWLADHHSLVVSAGASWSPAGLNLNYGSAGIYPHAGNTVQFQFVHLLAVLLAESYKLGGDALMFRTPVILGALGLCTVYLVGCRLVRNPWVAVAACGALGISLPELAVTRDTYSEPLTQILLWAAIWLFIRTNEERRFQVALMAGLAAGGTLMTHIDAIIYLVPVPLLGALCWVGPRSTRNRRSWLRVAGGVVIGIVPPALLGTRDVQLRASGYYHDLHGKVASLYSALGLATVVAALIIILWPSLGRVRSFLLTRRRRLALIAGGTVVAGLAMAWTLRPAGPKNIGSLYFPGIAGLQAAENVPVQGFRTYGDQSMVWMAWYIGPVALGLAIAGLGFLTARVVSRGVARATVLLAMTGPVAALYLWNPEITPFQIWATRRYVPGVLPLILLAAAVTLDSAMTLAASHFDRSAWPQWILFVGAVGLIAFPLGATLPVGKFQVENGDLPLVDRVCHTIGPQAAVLFPPGDPDGEALTQTLRSWCNVPAGQLITPLDPEQVSSAVAGMQTVGRTLWVLGSSVGKVEAAAPSLAPELIGTALNTRQIKPTVSTPANNYYSTSLTVYAAKVPT